MRLAAQTRGGFYPAPPETVTLASTFVRPPAKEPLTIPDACAGEGVAIRQLRAALGWPPIRFVCMGHDRFPYGGPYGIE